ncbi:MAG: DNA-formamidopyrimidine glycosylase family protein [Flavipsychrobacter sp.]
MPELPDLQVFSKNLTKQLKGKTVDDVIVYEDKKLNVSPATLKKHLQGKKLKEVNRYGKELHFIFDDDTVLALHLMLRGQLFIFEGDNKHKNSIVALIFKDGAGLVLVDYQKNATPTLDPKPKDAPDALGKDMNFDYLKQKMSATRAAIKNVITDQHVILGIGNAYADEILWEAGISPFSAANKIPDNKIKDLIAAIKNVLKDAEKQILELSPDIISGETRSFLKIHNSKLQRSPTGAIIYSKGSTSKTYFTDEQALYK